MGRSSKKSSTNTRMVKTSVLPAVTFSFFRIEAFNGRIYSPALLLKKIDVRQTLLCSVTLTGRESNPRSKPKKVFFIFIDSVFGRLAMYQAASPGQIHTRDLNLYVVCCKLFCLLKKIFFQIARINLLSYAVFR